MDTGGVIGYQRRELSVLYHLETAAEAHARVLIPAVVLAEALRGRPEDARVHRLIQSSWVTFTGLSRARKAGELLSLTGRDNTIDALVAAEAVSHRCILLTSNAGDLQELVDAAGAAKHVLVIEV